MIRFKKTELTNGIRVVSENHPHSHAAALGVWVLTGTRDEDPKVAGISHFLEHMVFKGTKTRSAFQIAKSLEALGGELNAFTTREYTCYHAYVLKDHWYKGLDVLSDLASNMALKRDDFRLEKSVVLQEIAMSEDELEDLIFDVYFDRALGRHPLGRPILGNLKSIAKLKQSQVLQYYRERYIGNNIIVSCTGNVDHQELVEAVQKFLGGKIKRRVGSASRKPRHRPFREVIEKPGEQTHLLIGFPCTSFKDKLRFEAFIVNTLLGGGMTSKLYQKIREKRGLVYTIHSGLSTFLNFGLLSIYAACEPKNMKQVVKCISSELRRVVKSGISQAELDLFKTQVTGSVLLGADDIDNRMQSIAINELVFGKYKPVENIIEEINKVTVKSVNEYLRRYLDLENVGAVLMGAGANELSDWFKEIDFKK